LSDRVLLAQSGTAGRQHRRAHRVSEARHLQGKLVLEVR